MEKLLKVMEENEKRRLQVINDLFEKGVVFLSLDGVRIDDTVIVGKGTVIEPGVTLKGDTVIGENCTLTTGTVVENCRIGDRTVINASQCYDSVIGSGGRIGPFAHIRPQSQIADGVKIGDFVEVKNSTLGTGTSVAHLTYVGDSDVGKNVNFGCGCVTVNYDGVRKSRCRIGDGAFIGCNTNLIAPVTIGADTFVAAGSTITDDLPDEGFAIARARQVNKEGRGIEKLQRKKKE